MPCNACGKVYDVTTLTCIKGAETVADKMVSAGNKLSVAKFLCPEPGCGKSVDVKYLQGNQVNIARYHEMKGVRVSMQGGSRKAAVFTPPSLSMIAELYEKQNEIRARQMGEMLALAETEIKSADDRIEAQLALIVQAEERIEKITADKAKAEEILTNPEYEQFRIKIPAVVEEAVGQ